MENEILEELLDNPVKEKKIKRLPPSVVRDLNAKNAARHHVQLEPIKVKVRACIACGQLFESAGNRNCGCNARHTGYIAGREII